MKRYIAAQVAHNKKDSDSGNTRRVTDTYYQAALSVVEACAHLTTHLAPELSDMEIGPTKPLGISDVLCAPAPENENARWFEARIELHPATEDNPKARPVRQTIMVEAKDWASASTRLQEELGKWIAPVEVLWLKKSAVVDVLEAPEMGTPEPAKEEAPAEPADEVCTS